MLTHIVIFVTVFSDTVVAKTRIGSFMVLGDWGYNPAPHLHGNVQPQCQGLIGNAMRQFDDNNPDMKFVINLGDSFYPDGIESPGEDRWNWNWREVYGEALTNKRWYSVYGNHDYEGKDACACGDPAQDGALCSQRHTGVQGGWFMPELYYFDTFFQDELGIEIIAMDTNFVDAEVVCHYARISRPWQCDSCRANLQARMSDSMNMLKDRLARTTAKNVLVFSHYPTDYFGGNPDFINDLRTNAVNVQYFGGHRHTTDNGPNQSHDLSPNQGWCVGGGGGWSCDSPFQGFLVGLIFDDGSIEMIPQYVDSRACCGGGVEPVPNPAIPVYPTRPAVYPEQPGDLPGPPDAPPPYETEPPHDRRLRSMCSANRGCVEAGLIHDNACCPTEGGVMLACCTWTSKQAS